MPVQQDIARKAMQAMEFGDKHILITGASAGIGLAMACAFARHGARVALLARDHARLEAAAAQVADCGPAPEVVVADCRDVAALGREMDALAARWGGLDGVVANAGYCHPGRFADLPLNDLHRQIDTNLMGTLNTLHLALPYLRRGAFAALTSSPAGALPIYGFAAYGATKAALSSLAETLRQELREREIAVHLLFPPDTDTPGYAQEVTLYPAETRAILAGGKLLSPEAVAASFIAGIAAGRPLIVAGSEARLALALQRFAPGVWDWYCRRCIRIARHKT